MPAFIDLTGQTFSRLTVVSRAPNVGKLVAWNCKCSCGTDTIVVSGNLRSGNTTACKCVRTAKIIEIGHQNKTHGMRKTPEYVIHTSMKQRCLNKNASAYKDYGARGVTVCDRWMKFENFISDMGKKPSQSHSIERRDNDGNYTPENCYWATRIQQENNKRTNINLTFNGKTQTAAQWARELDVAPYLIYQRLKRCWSVERALTEAPQSRFLSR